MLPEASLSFSYIYVRLGGTVKTRSVSVASGAPVRPLSRFKFSPDFRRAEKRYTTIVAAL